ncbi:MAG: sulfotransferase family 2 domain-containing protein [Flavobacteriales bacterium]|nr:sulfotransferase family 2 domain-containing protein [Flavobacteriales bacterium]
MKINIHQKRLISSVLPGRYLRYLYALNKASAIQIDALKLIYVPIPKVANRSIKEILAERIRLKYTVSAHKAKWKYIPLASVAKSSSYSFSFVRNPLDRLVSCYVQKTQMKDPIHNFWKYGNLVYPNMSFTAFVSMVCKTPDYLADRHFKSQHQFLIINGDLSVDYLGKYESLKEDWKFLSEKFELPTLVHANPSVRTGIENYYTKELAQKAQKRYIQDIETFGYTQEVNSFINSL